LRTLTLTPATPASVLDAYLFRLASVAGYHPYLEACAGCGAPGAHTVFSIAAGGLLCTGCAPGDTHTLAPGVLELLQTFAGGDLTALGASSAPSRIRRAAGALVNSFLTYHLGKPLASWELVPR
jgi:DNA repair protein RecO (recombination protein O)